MTFHNDKEEIPAAQPEVLCRNPLVLLGTYGVSTAEELAARAQRLCPEGPLALLTDLAPDGEGAQTLLPLSARTQAVFCLTPDDDISAGIAAALSASGEDGAVVFFVSGSQAAAVHDAFHPTYRKWLRKRKIRARDSLSPEERERLSALAVRQIVASPEFQQAQTVMLYRAVRGEVRLDALESAPEARGKRLVYPLCVSQTEMKAFYPLSDDSWKPGYCGITEPVAEKSAEIAPEDIDLVLCPCTVFDERGNRMGMGAGFYDRYLPRCTKAHIASVAFEVQKTSRVPADPWDRAMQITFTEAGTYRQIP